MSLEDRCRVHFAGSACLAAEAGSRFPGGVTHAGWGATPFPLFITRATGAYKYDVDDNRLSDDWCGH